MDLVIRNGLIVDGSGGEPTYGDLGITDGRIVAVGVVTEPGSREIDATGLAVTPGFVDIHTHYDGQAIWSDRLNPSSGHGVTTVVVGNCGVGFAPCRPTDHDLLIIVMEGVEDIPGPVMANGLDWTWETFPEYLDAVEARPHDIDIAAYLPHSPLRVYVMGERGAERETATPEELRRFRELAREAIEAGAMGIASSRTAAHRTASGEAIPTFQADFLELEAIALGLADAGAGVIQLVPASAVNGYAAELKPLIDLGVQTGRTVTFTLTMANSPDAPAVWQEAVELLEQARADGSTAKAQVLPRPIGLVVGLDVSAHPFSTVPAYRSIEDLPLHERAKEMRKPEVRARILAEAPSIHTRCTHLPGTSSGCSGWPTRRTTSRPWTPAFPRSPVSEGYRPRSRRTTCCWKTTAPA